MYHRVADRGVGVGRGWVDGEQRGGAKHIGTCLGASFRSSITVPFAGCDLVSHERRVGGQRGTITGPFLSAPPRTGRTPFGVSGAPVPDCRTHGWQHDRYGCWHLAYRPASLPQTPAALSHVDGFPVL